jgi:hypothetical protein
VNPGVGNFQLPEVGSFELPLTPLRRSRRRRPKDCPDPLQETRQRPPLTLLPPVYGRLVDSELSGESLPGQPHRLTRSGKPRGPGLAGVDRCIAEEADDARQLTYLRLGSVSFPTRNRPGSAADSLGRTPLQEPQFQPASPDPLAPGLWLRLKIGE